MFYCEPCRAKNDWPKSLSVKSEGKCENCAESGVICHDVPTHLLDDPDELAAAEARLRAIGGGPVLDAIRSDDPRLEELMEDFARNPAAREAVLRNAVIVVVPGSTK